MSTITIQVGVLLVAFVLLVHSSPPQFYYTYILGAECNQVQEMPSSITRLNICWEDQGEFSTDFINSNGLLETQTCSDPQCSLNCNVTSTVQFGSCAQNYPGDYYMVALVKELPTFDNVTYQVVYSSQWKTCTNSLQDMYATLEIWAASSPGTCQPAACDCATRFWCEQFLCEIPPFFSE